MKLLLLQFFLAIFWNGHSATIPLVVNTWKFENATRNAWSVLKSNEPYEQKVYDALIVGCGTCQKEQCDFTVGYGGSPDENGETTLDALIFDGDTINMGAVGGLRRIKNAIAVAKLVLDNTEHSVLVGDLSTEFAKKLGFNEETLSTNHSINVWKTWEKQNCQPNFWKNVSPDPKTQCGPYKPIKHISRTNIIVKEFSSNNHDTIGMIVIDENGHIVAGTSTNGANHKIPGRIGDSPIPGAGAYADSDVGAATATGDGDVMMRFLPSFLAVEQMRNGMSPAKAAKVAILRIAVKYPTFFGGIVAVNKKGEIGAACNGMDKFPFTLANYENDEPITKYVECTNYNSNK